MIPKVAPRSLERRMLSDARLLLHRFERRERGSSKPVTLADLDAEFVPMTRRTYRASPHLDLRIVTRSPRVHRIAVVRLAERLDLGVVDRAPPRFLFHTAFCGSTLLANCFDRPGFCLAYKEPLALSQLCLILAGDREEGRLIEEEWSTLARVSASLLSKTFSPAERALIKASHAGSLAMRQLLTLSSSRGIFLHSDLQSFVCSILKSEGRRQWVRTQLRWVRQAARSVVELAEIDPAALSDAQAAAYVWLWQVLNYLDASRALGEDVLRSMSFERFLDHPEELLIAAAGFLSAPLSEEEARRTVSSQLFRTYSKTGVDGRGFGRLLSRVGLLMARPRAYDKDSRRRELDEVVSRHGEDLESAARWAENVSNRAPFSGHLPFPLGRMEA